MAFRLAGSNRDRAVDIMRSRWSWSCPALIRALADATTRPRVIVSEVEVVWLLALFPSNFYLVLSHLISWTSLSVCI